MFLMLGKTTYFNRLYLVLCICISVLLSSALAVAESENHSPSKSYTSPRFTLYIGSRGDSSLKNSVQAQDVAEQAISILDTTIDEVDRIFGIQLTDKVVLRFLSPKEFRAETGSPAWTSAMYYGGEITVPISPGKRVNLTELRRALRHEYVHAIVAQVSAQRCPAWLDEGLAQIIEGPANPLLGPSLREWVGDNDILPLSWLQDGFMTLDEKVVPVAYAQSLFAARSLVNRCGFAGIRAYLLQLGDGTDPDAAFHAVFGSSNSHFEDQLALQISRWADSDIQDP